MKEVKGGGIDHVSQKKGPFCNPKTYSMGTSRFMENKTMHFGKSQFMATMEIPIHEGKKISISHFTSNKKGRSQVTKIPIPPS